MIDRRFYDVGPRVGLAELERLTGAAARAGAAQHGRSFASVATLDAADGDCIAYCAGVGFLDALAATGAGACFIAPTLAERAPEGCVALVTAYPQYAYAMAAGRLVVSREIDPDAEAVHPGARLEDGVVVGRGATIGAGAEIGAETRIGAGATIGPGVCIGRQARIGPGAVIGFALIGDRVHIHAGAVIGEPGFGAAPGPRGLVSLPQLGRVILQDDVRIGANTCVDRGAWDDTVIGERTKIDNLVHIGHNVVVGRDCVMAAYTGISGSCVIGDGCMFGGRAGVVDHIRIGNGARIAADSAVMKHVPAGESWAGSPARPIKTWLRQSAWLARASRRDQD
jgi:UDP-3-O-[3-hydroxymyristoyl] glucosamine N-acyltransferase